MEYIQINTSQNVNIKFLQAGIGLRMLCFAIDWGIKIAYLLALDFIIKITGINIYIDSLDKFSTVAIYILLSLPVTFYTLFHEAVMEGQTPAKRWLKIKVIKIDGYQARFSDYLIRWFFALVDFYFSTGVVAVISIIVSRKGQRLGGLASGTTVINLRNKVNINHTILEELSLGYKATFPNVMLLNDEDMQIIKTHFQKAKANKDYQTIRKLAVKITEVTQSQQGKMNDMDFIDVIIRDYNYLSRKETGFKE